MQQQRRQLNTNTDVVILTNLFAIVFIFTSIFLVNAVIMNSAASAFNSYAFLVPSFQDDLMFIDQVNFHLISGYYTKDVFWFACK